MDNMRKFVEMLKEPECNGADLVNEASRMCSVLCLGTERIMDEIKENTETSDVFQDRIALPWIMQLYEMAQDRMYDARNEMAIKIGAALYKTLVQLDFISCKPADRSKDFVAGMSREHRTIQQSFSGIVFLYLAKVLDGKGMLAEADELMSLEGFPYGVWREELPLI